MEFKSEKKIEKHHIRTIKLYDAMSDFSWKIALIHYFWGQVDNIDIWDLTSYQLLSFIGDWRSNVALGFYIYEGRPNC